MYRQQEPEINLEQLLSRFKGIFGRFGGKGKGIGPLIVVAIFAIIIVLWAASGIYTVQPGEEAAVRLFGKYSSAQESGLHCIQFYLKLMKSGLIPKIHQFYFSLLKAALVF